MPILVDYFTRDGSTLMMRLLASSPQIAVERAYPYERKYFAYLWRWSRLLDREDWPEEQWAPQGPRLAPAGARPRPCSARRRGSRGR